MPEHEPSQRTIRDSLAEEAAANRDQSLESLLAGYGMATLSERRTVDDVRRAVDEGNAPWRFQREKDEAFYAHRRDVYRAEIQRRITNSPEGEITWRADVDRALALYEGRVARLEEEFSSRGVDLGPGR